MTFAETKVSLNFIYKYTSSNGLKGSFTDTENGMSTNEQETAMLNADFRSGGEQFEHSVSAVLFLFSGINAVVLLYKCWEII